jgi:nucleotide-binding universal stress UspA family protein
MKRVLVPVDFSNNSDAAIRYAISFAQDAKCQLVFFHSSITLIPAGGPVNAYRNAVSEDTSSKEKLLKDKFEQISRELDIMSDPSQIKYVVKHGGPVHDQIIKVIKEEDIDLCIISTHGATGLKKIFMGSVTSKIIENSPVPVLAIPVNFNYHSIEKIIYSSDLRDYEYEIKQVRSFATFINAHIEILSFNHSAPVSEHERVELAKEGISFTEKTIDDKPLITHLKSYLTRKPECILTMFTHPRTRLGKFFLGSNTEEIAMDLHFPLLTFQKRDI